MSGPQQMLLAAGVAAAGPSIPIPPDDNITAGNEGTATTGWGTPTNSGVLSQSGSTVRLTRNGAGAGTVSVLSLSGPTTNDYVLYLKMAANHVSGQYGYLSFRSAGPTNAFDIIMGYNYETSAAQLGTISSFDYNSSTGNNIATGVTVSTQQEFAIHVDRNRSCVNLFYREPGTGKWDFRGQYTYNSRYGNLVDVSLVTSGHSGQWVEYDWILYTRPNYLAIGDSICAGHNFFDPNPSVYAGEDDYDNTWMKHCLIGQSLRNNLIVNKGIGSQTSAQTLARITEATSHQAKVVFLHASTNDQAGTPVAQATRTSNIQDSIDAIVAASADCVLLNAMYGTSAAGDNTPTPDLRDYMLDWWDNYRPTLSPQPELAIDIMQPMLDSGFQRASDTEADGLHPDAGGYQLIGEYIETFE
jgi:lysophospholipase L1-like esterase